jgi:hypothetical protein
MYRRLLDNTNTITDDRTGYTVTLRKERHKEIDPRKTIRSLLFTAFSLKDETTEKLPNKLICTHTDIQNKHTEIFLVPFDETVSMRLSCKAEIRAASREEIMFLIETDPYIFTWETRDMMNVVFSLDKELGKIRKEKANGSQI